MTACLIATGAVDPALFRCGDRQTLATARIAQGRAHPAAPMVRLNKRA
ncbi:MAG: hypothetical protein JNK96_08000 [Betaproteobacteria bacterium]|jgi:hypothetical protein|nr:hypothetical protein [Betaproteobacteria bacterium]